MTKRTAALAITSLLLSLSCSSDELGSDDTTEHDPADLGDTHQDQSLPSDLPLGDDWQDGPETAPTPDLALADGHPGEDLSSAADSGIDLSPLPPDQVRLVRDRWGVPHVLATSERAAGYGLGWAMAEDQLTALLTSLWTAQGRRTEVEGEEMLAVDRTMRLLRLVSDVEATWDTLPSEATEYLDGFAGGITAYMEANPDEVPSWAEPIAPAWVVGLGRLFFFVPQMRQADGERGDLGPSVPMLSFSADEEFGSNGWAMAPERTDSGFALLSGDPHMPWLFEWRMYEFHVRSPSFEVAGGAMLGLPLPIFGHNESVAWTWTWNSADHADTYALALDPDNPEAYLLDGESVPFQTEEASFQLPDGSTLTETLRWSVHGPVFNHVPEEHRALAYFLTVFGQTETVAQLMEMSQSETLDDFNGALSRLQLGHFNSIAADNSGSVQYVWHARVPQRSDDVDHASPLDGTTSDTLWGTEVIPLDELPTVRDPAVGFVQNCNNAPWFATGTEVDPGPDVDVGGAMLDDRDTARAWRARQALSQPGVFTADDGLALTTEGTMIPATVFAPLIREAWSRYGSTHPEADLIEPVVSAMADWNGHPDLDSAVPTIFLTWAYEFGGETFFPADRLDLTVDDLDEDLGLELLDAVVAGRALLEDNFGFWEIPYGLFHVINRGGTWPVETGQHPAISMFNCNVDPFSGVSLECAIGSAYTFFSIMSDPIQTWSVMPLGNTDHMTSDYYNVQTALFSTRELKPLPFDDAGIREHLSTEEVLTLPAD